MDNELKCRNHSHHPGTARNGDGRKTQYAAQLRYHVVGCDNLEKMCDVIKDMGVKYLTVYAFSTENWKRSRAEVVGTS